MNGTQRNLTEAATKTLEEFVSTERERIISAASEIAGFADYGQPITSSDLTEAISRLRSQPRSIPSKLQLISDAYKFAGLSMVAAGVVWILKDRLGIELADTPGIWLSVGGFFIALLGVFVGRYTAFLLRSRTRASDISLSDLQVRFISAWLAIESGLRRTASIVLGESQAAAPITVIIRELEKHLPEYGALHALLKFRNRIVHSRGDDLSKPELLTALAEAQRVLTRLHLTRDIEV